MSSITNAITSCAEKVGGLQIMSQNDPLRGCTGKYGHRLTFDIFNRTVSVSMLYVYIAIAVVVIAIVVSAIAANLTTRIKKPKNYIPN